MLENNLRRRRGLCVKWRRTGIMWICSVVLNNIIEHQHWEAKVTILDYFWWGYIFFSFFFVFIYSPVGLLVIIQSNKLSGFITSWCKGPSLKKGEKKKRKTLNVVLSLMQKASIRRKKPPRYHFTTNSNKILCFLDQTEICRLSLWAHKHCVIVISPYVQEKGINLIKATKMFYFLCHTKELTLWCS